jgi:hypothetical protein
VEKRAARDLRDIAILKSHYNQDIDQQGQDDMNQQGQDDMEESDGGDSSEWSQEKVYAQSRQEEDSQQQQRENEERRCKAQCSTPIEWRDEKPPREVDRDHQRQEGYPRRDQGRVEGERQPRDDQSSSDSENEEHAEKRHVEEKKEHHGRHHQRQKKAADKKAAQDRDRKQLDQSHWESISPGGDKRNKPHKQRSGDQQQDQQQDQQSNIKQDADRFKDASKQKAQHVADKTGEMARGAQEGVKQTWDATKQKTKEITGTGSDNDDREGSTREGRDGVREREQFQQSQRRAQDAQERQRSAGQGDQPASDFGRLSPQHRFEGHQMQDHARQIPGEHHSHTRQRERPLEQYYGQKAGSDRDDDEKQTHQQSHSQSLEQCETRSGAQKIDLQQDLRDEKEQHGQQNVSSPKGKNRRGGRQWDSQMAE